MQIVVYILIEDCKIMFKFPLPLLKLPFEEIAHLAMHYNENNREWKQVRFFYIRYHLIKQTNVNFKVLPSASFLIMYIE